MTKRETKREKELRLLRNRIERMEAQREAAIASLVRVETMLPGMRKQAERLAWKLLHKPTLVTSKVQDASAAPALHVPEDRSVHDDAVVPKDNPSAKAPGGDPKEEGIPAFLLRSPLPPDVAVAAHAVANAHNAPPTEEQKKLVAKEKAAVKKEQKQALLTGAKRKWPVTGKAALAKLR